MKKNTQTNPNDINAEYYDDIYSHTKGRETTLKELSLISALINSNKAKILDVGCGTGRHSLELIEMGYEVDMIDSSRGMLNQIKSEKDIIVFHGDIFKYSTEKKYNLIILMWNTFNEIAITKDQSIQLFVKLCNLLEKGGKILINTEKITKFPFKPEYNFEKTIENNHYKVSWEVKYINKIGNITKSVEKVTINNKETRESYITQRWWKESEIKDLAKIFNLKYSIQKIPGIKELYIVLSS